MFAYIKGSLTYAFATHVVVEAGGIGHKIFIPANVFSRLPATGKDIFLHTSFVVREQAQTLYGFLQIQERDFFESLLSVTGIGPKLALAMVGHMQLSELHRAISEEDGPALCKIPGIGKKSAERIIIEMRDKVSIHAVSPSDFAVHGCCDPKMQHVHDAMSALINLGYSQATAQNAIKKSLKTIPEGIDLAMLISSALKHI